MVLPQLEHMEEPHEKTQRHSLGSRDERPHGVRGSAQGRKDGHEELVGQVGGTGRLATTCALPQGRYNGGQPGSTWMPFSLQVQVPCVGGDAGRDFCQLSPGADYPTGLVAAGAAGQEVAGGRLRQQMSGPRLPRRPPGAGREPEGQQGPMGPGHPTGRQWGAQGAAGAAPSSMFMPRLGAGGCGVGERKRLSEGRDLPLQKPSSSPKSRQLSAAAATKAQDPRARPPQVPGMRAQQAEGGQTAGAGPQHTISVLGRLYAHFPEQKTESRGEDVPTGRDSS